MKSASSCCYCLVDIGVNLGHPSFVKDFEKVLERAKEAGLLKVMITGSCEKTTLQASKLAAENPGFLYYTAGVHPHEAKEFVEGSTIQFLKAHLKNPACVAVGECGLDFNRNFSPRDQQLNAFEKQVQLACELGKPLFIHERDAHTEMVEILSRHGAKLPPAVIHCFTGTADQAKVYLDMGLYIGLTGFLWKDRSENGVKFALKSRLIPLDRLLLETDAPFMYPKVNDKKIPAEIRERFTQKALDLHKFTSFDRNEPCALPAVCEMIAGYMGVPPEEVARQTTENALRVYGLN